MFDDQKPTNANQQPQSAVNNSQAGGRVEDIFSGVDQKEQSARPMTEPSFSPEEQIKTSNLPPQLNGDEDESVPVSMGEMMTMPKKQGKKSKIIIIAAIILAAIILVVGGWYLYSQSTVMNNVNENNNEMNINNSLPITNDNKNINENDNENQNMNDNVNNVNIGTVNTNTPARVDSDFDGLTDEEEKSFNTDPNSADSDNDGLLDREEVRIYKTDPLNSDSDGDSYLDGQEVRGGYNPLGEGKLTVPNN